MYIYLYSYVYVYTIHKCGMALMTWFVRSWCVAGEIESARNQWHTCTNSTTHELNHPHFIANTYTFEMSLHEIRSRELDCTNVCVCDEVCVVEFVHVCHWVRARVSLSSCTQVCVVEFVQSNFTYQQCRVIAGGRCSMCYSVCCSVYYSVCCSVYYSVCCSCGEACMDFKEATNRSQQYSPG